MTEAQLEENDFAREQELARQSVYWEWGMAEGQCEAGKRFTEGFLSAILIYLENFCSELPKGSPSRRELERMITDARKAQTGLMTAFRGMFEVMEEAYGDRPVKSGTVGRAVSKRTKERIKNAGR